MLPALPDLDGAVWRFDRAVSRYLGAVRGVAGSRVEVDRAAAVYLAQRSLQEVALRWFDRVAEEEGVDRADTLLAGIDAPSFSAATVARARMRELIRRGHPAPDTGLARAEYQQRLQSWQSALTCARVFARHGEDSARAVLAALERPVVITTALNPPDPRARRRRRLATEYELVGPKDYFDRLVKEYRWSRSHLEGKVAVQAAGWRQADGKRPPWDYYLRRWLLRAHPPFDGAGDAEAVRFCQEIAGHMAEQFGIPADEAIARVNQHWPGNGRVPPVWIVGLSIAYHQQAARHAGDIYYGRQSSWWLPDANPAPLPPPPT